MPIVEILPNGGKSYMTYPAPTRPQPLRGVTSGWSRDVSRRNSDFLMSVQVEQLTGHGYALSLTLKDCPCTPRDWQSIRTAYVKRLRRMGLVRMHWLTEWQRRQVPHLHAAVWFDRPQDPARILMHWLAVAAPYRAGPHSQHCTEIRGTVGWFEYLAKHAARSVWNYQRSPENVPRQWAGVTGRMWGRIGSWPVSEAKQVEIPWGPWWRYRRRMIHYQLAKARRQGDSARYRYLKAYRQRAPKVTSRSQPVPRFWIPEEDQWQLLINSLRPEDQ